MDRTLSSAATGPSRVRRQVLKAAAALSLSPALASARSFEAGLLAELDQWLARHLPEVAASLNPGASDEQLDHLATVIGVPLPDDYRALYRWHDGQKEPSLTGPWYGLGFPSLHQVEQILAQWVAYADDPWCEFNELAFSVKPGVVKPLYANRLWIPFAQAGNNYLGIDLDPDIHGVRGQVINFGRDEDLKHAIAPSLMAFVQWQIGQLQAGNFHIRQERGGGRSFNTLNPPTRHILDSIQTMFGEAA